MDLKPTNKNNNATSKDSSVVDVQPSASAAPPCNEAGRDSQFPKKIVTNVGDDKSTQQDND